MEDTRNTENTEIIEIVEEEAVFTEETLLPAEQDNAPEFSADDKDEEEDGELNAGNENMPAGLDDDIEGDLGSADQIFDSAEAGGTIRVTGVRFRTAGKAYYFSPGNFDVRRGTHVIVETARGVEYGTAVSDPVEIEKKRMRTPVRQILRIADEDDLRQVVLNKAKEKEALRVCRQKIREHNLDMKLIDAEYTFDGSRILFYFTAEGRVDFRDLVKDLAAVFRTRIELRQIGVRDETKILGGYGICGRPLCCHSYLSDFIPVSIKMAKEQNLSLNPTKISGLCGRLMCCLKNEEDTYEELNRQLPRIGDEVEGNDGLQGEVESVNVLRQRVRILVDVDDEKELHEYPASDVTILRRRRRGQARPKLTRNNASDQNRKPAQAAPRKTAAAAEELRREDAGKTEEKRSGARKAEENRPEENSTRQSSRPPRERRKNDRKDRPRQENEGSGQRGKQQGRRAEADREGAPVNQAAGSPEPKKAAEQETKEHADRRSGRNRRDNRRRSGHGRGKENAGTPSAE